MAIKASSFDSNPLKITDKQKEFLKNYTDLTMQRIDEMTRAQASEYISSVIEMWEDDGDYPSDEPYTKDFYEI